MTADYALQGEAGHGDEGENLDEIARLSFLSVPLALTFDVDDQVRVQWRHATAAFYREVEPRDVPCELVVADPFRWNSVVSAPAMAMARGCTAALRLPAAIEIESSTLLPG